MRRFLKILRKTKIVLIGAIVLMVLSAVFTCIQFSGPGHHDDGHPQAIGCHTFASYTSINQIGNRIGILFAASLLLLFGLFKLFVGIPLQAKKLTLSLSSRYIYFIRRFIPPPTSSLFYAFKKGLIHTQVYSIDR